MDLSNFGFFWQQMLDNPLLMLAVAMAMASFWSMAGRMIPMAIATCVVTRCMSARAAYLPGRFCYEYV